MFMDTAGKMSARRIAIALTLCIDLMDLIIVALALNGRTFATRIRKNFRRARTADVRPRQ